MYDAHHILQHSVHCGCVQIYADLLLICATQVSHRIVTDSRVCCCSMQGNWKAALRVKHRMKQAGLTPTVHVYNALIAACERDQQLDLGVEITKEMRRTGVEPNSTTMMLMQGLGSKGVALTEKQQVAAAALSAAVAAAGHLAMRTGMW